MRLHGTLSKYLGGAGAAVLLAVAVLSATPQQSNRSAGLELLKEVSGTWVPEEFKKVSGKWVPESTLGTTHYLVLKLNENDGNLTGTISHFKIRTDQGGAITGTPLEIPDSPLTDLTFWEGAVHFTWGGDAPLRGGRVDMRFDGTEAANLLIPASPEEMMKVMSENDSASFGPIIQLRRISEAEDRKLPENSPGKRETQSIPVSVINAAEFLYKFDNGVYADYPTLIHFGKLGWGYKIIVRPGTDPFPDNIIHLAVSADRRSYKLSVAEKSTAACAEHADSDETGIIFDDRPAGCDSE